MSPFSLVPLPCELERDVVVIVDYSIRSSITRAAVILAVGAIAVAPLVNSSPTPASATLSVSYDFNTPGMSSNSFNRSGTLTHITESVDRGVTSTGSISLALNQSADAVFSSKDGYSMGPVGSTYTFSSFMKSVGNSGYSGMGFTTTTAPSINSGNPYRPTSALGFSVHGGGFVFHNGANDRHGNWSDGTQGSTSSSLTVVRKSPIFDLLNDGSVDDWYKVVMIVERTGGNKFTQTVEVWPADSQGVLRNATAPRAPATDPAVRLVLTDVVNSTITSASKIFSYINFSGYRVTEFDNFEINLGGGATIVEEGAPTVLTTNAILDGSGERVDVEGNLLDPGGTLDEKGFVFSTSPTPTVTDPNDSQIVVASSGTGSFTSKTAALPNGTYFFRAFAENTSGKISYGVEKQQAITASSVAPPSSQPGASGGGGFVGPRLKPDIPMKTEFTLTGVSSGARVGVIYGGAPDRQPSIYTIRSSPGFGTCVVTIPPSNCEIKGLRNNRVYDFTASAANQFGQSNRSVSLGRLLFRDGKLYSQKSSDRVVNFAGESAELTKTMRSQVRQTLTKVSAPNTLFYCTGFTAGDPPKPSDMALARERGKAVCDYIKSLRPGAEVVVDGKTPGLPWSPTSRRVGFESFSLAG